MLPNRHSPRRAATSTRRTTRAIQPTDEPIRGPASSQPLHVTSRLSGIVMSGEQHGYVPTSFE